MVNLEVLFILVVFYSLRNEQIGISCQQKIFFAGLVSFKSWVMSHFTTDSIQIRACSRTHRHRPAVQLTIVSMQ